jgi:hypothetical protein
LQFRQIVETDAMGHTKRTTKYASVFLIL